MVNDEAAYIVVPRLLVVSISQVIVWRNSDTHFTSPFFRWFIST